MTKVVGMLVALAMFCAMPAVAFAQDDGDNVSSGNTQNGTQNGTASGGDASGGSASGGGSGDEDGDGSGGDASGGDGGRGGDAGVQQGMCQQNAGEDANCEINQSQSFGGDTWVDVDGDGIDDDNDAHVRHHGVQSVRLARTGFDAWLLALVGGISLAGGLGLIAAQRRGRLHV